MILTFVIFLTLGLIAPSFVQAAPSEVTSFSQNTTPSPIVASASETYSASASNLHPNVPASAFDGKESSAWIKDNTTSGWIKVDLGSNEQSVISGLELTPAHSTWPGSGVRDFTLEGSNDDRTWILLFNGTAENSTSLQRFTFSNSTAYRFYRVSILNSYTIHIGLSEVGLIPPSSYLL